MLGDDSCNRQQRKELKILWPWNVHRIAIGMMNSKSLVQWSESRDAGISWKWAGETRSQSTQKLFNNICWFWVVDSYFNVADFLVESLWYIEFETLFMLSKWFIEREFETILVTGIIYETHRLMNYHKNRPVKESIIIRIQIISMDRSGVRL